MNKSDIIRNILVIAGAYYLSTMVFGTIGCWLIRLTEGTIYSGFWGSIFMNVTNIAPFAFVCFFAGIASGYSVKSSRPYMWAVLLFMFATINGYRSVHYPREIGVEELLTKMAHGFIPGIFAIIGFTLVLKGNLSLHWPSKDNNSINSD